MILQQPPTDLCIHAAMKLKETEISSLKFVKHLKTTRYRNCWR